MEPKSQRVAVVGAGPSGLATVKALLEEGHDPVCFERAPSLGGVFRRGEDDGVCWDSCRLTSSGMVTAFSDFPVAPDRTGHMTAAEYLDYLTAYCDAFGVTERIRYGTTVESVAQRADGGWDVRASTTAGTTHDAVFDAVAVCSGLNQDPHVPSFAGEETFTGELMHGSRYRRPSQLRGRRVLVVGAGESGADIAAEAAEHADETILSMRRGVAVRPRLVRGLPNDCQITRLNHSPSHWIFQTRNPRDGSKRRVYRLAFFPFLVVERCLQTVSRFAYGTLPIVRPGRLAGGRAAVAEARTELRVRRLIRQLLRESGGRALEQFGTKTDDFVRAIVTGSCRRVGPISRFERDRVLFADGSSAEPDLVIQCTGFEAKMPFLAEAVTRPPRFLHAFDPTIGRSLAFIGFVRPAFGAIPPLAELQARWFALLLSGRAELPNEAEMRASIERQTDFHRNFFRALDGRLDFLVDFTTACDELATQVGCKPSNAAIRRESPAFRFRFYAGPFVAAQYRLLGPHARPEIARRVIESLPVGHPPPMLTVYYLHWRLSRLLHRLLGPEFAPKLALDVRSARA